MKVAAYIANALFSEGYAAIFIVESWMVLRCRAHKAPGAISLSGAEEARATRTMNQIQEQEFFEESEGFLYDPKISVPRT